MQGLNEDEHKRVANELRGLVSSQLASSRAEPAVPPPQHLGDQPHSTVSVENEEKSHRENI